MIGNISFRPKIPLTRKHFSDTQRTEAKLGRILSNQFLKIFLTWLSLTNQPDHQPA